ncbi:membrane lipoprotein lipid attachment site-containing protein [Thermoflavimicrobium dichotomicum]|uniref:Lipoprotein n=1 Tax=Thermoflavimicrobium dichotomicum TaxID=46223 RepID=A0A1I3TCC2_9BACL|nr:membrane lipoprotein lipid attachment site-containing protein [Thermoflavimicrobium dichotomicum]SFJ68774.1 hypothetical protein SAMN05421852_11712 [Thermoflavimicrobium dichotomicum]
MKKVAIIFFALLLLTACGPPVSPVGTWVLKNEENKNGEKKADCPSQIKLGEDETAVINEKPSNIKKVNYYVQYSPKYDPELVLYQDSKEERAEFNQLEESYITLTFRDRGVTCEYNKAKN